MYQIEVTNLTKDGEIIAELTKTEARVLNYLIQHPNQLFSAETLAEKLELKSPNYVRNVMSRLIKQLNLPVETVLKQGWRWVESEVKK